MASRLVGAKPLSEPMMVIFIGTLTSQITSLAIVYLNIYSGADQRDTKAPRRRPLRGEFTGDQWIPAKMTRNAENVSICWRHHVTIVGLCRRFRQNISQYNLSFFEWIHHQYVQLYIHYVQLSL